MKRECEGHPKITRLCRRLRIHGHQIEPWQAYGLLTSIWMFTTKRAPHGDIGRYSNEDISIGIGYGFDENEMIEALIQSNWIDRDEKHRLVIHDWPDHCEDAVHMRLARAREFFANGEVPKLTRLGKLERESAEKWYAEEEQNAHKNEIQAHEPDIVRSTCAQYGDLCTPPLAPPRLSPAPPDDERTVVEASGSVAPSEQPASVRPSPPAEESRKTLGPVVVPTKSVSPPERPKPKPRGDIERITGMRDLLAGYLGMEGTELARPVKPPDDRIILRCLAAVGDAPLETVAQYLRRLYQAGQSPRHPNGPNGYAWFVPVLEREFSGTTGATA